MGRKDPSRHSRNILWRGRAVKLALAATGLATALAGAQMATQPSKPDDSAMSRTITQQEVASGQAPKAKDTGKPMSPDEMLVSADKYEQQMKGALEHAEAARQSARRVKDIIRTTCVEDKAGQMKQVYAIAKPRFTTIKDLTGDEFHMRAQFTVIREGAERIHQLMDELEACTGDSGEMVGDIRLQDERNLPGTSVTDPTLPANPQLDVQRPGQASPYY